MSAIKSTLASSVFDGRWNDLPAKTRKLLDSVTNGNNEYRLDDVIAFIMHSRNLFLKNNEYHWNLELSLSSAYLLATSYLITGREKPCRLMIFYCAFLEECLARGFDVVGDLLLRICKKETWRDERRRSVSIKILFSKFAFLHGAATNTKSRKGMATFLNVMMVKYFSKSDKICQYVRKLDASKAQLPSFNTFGVNIYDVIPEELIVIDLAGLVDDPENFMKVKAYNDTTLQWVFNYCVAITRGTCYQLLNGKSRINIKEFKCPLIRILEKESIFYLITSGTKSLRSLGIENGDVFQLLTMPHLDNNTTKSAPPQNKIPTVQSKRSNKANGKRSTRKRAPNAQVSSSKQELSLDAMRELHSKGMGPVFDELHPQLKKIRDKLSSLTLQKNHPKKKRSKKTRRVKETPGTAIFTVPIDDSFGGKAGKTAYPILVGEATNLFKTHQLRLRKTYRNTTLDLHGCHRDEALDMLRKGVCEWVGEAMKGEYPFVIPVNIICGGGNQVLSELVAQFIRDNPQVANRPKSIA